MTLEECEEFYQDTALGYFYGYDIQDKRWNLVINMQGYHYIDELGWWCKDRPVVDWYPT